MQLRFCSLFPTWHRGLPVSSYDSEVSFRALLDLSDRAEIEFHSVILLCHIK